MWSGDTPPRVLLSEALAGGEGGGSIERGGPDRDPLPCPKKGSIDGPPAALAGDLTSVNRVHRGVSGRPPLRPRRALHREGEAGPPALQGSKCPSNPTQSAPPHPRNGTITLAQAHTRDIPPPPPVPLSRSGLGVPRLMRIGPCKTSRPGNAHTHRPTRLRGASLLAATGVRHIDNSAHRWGRLRGTPLSRTVTGPYVDGKYQGGREGGIARGGARAVRIRPHALSRVAGSCGSGAGATAPCAFGVSGTTDLDHTWEFQPRTMCHSVL